VEVRLSLSNDQASLVLLSPHASVRDALQATLPRLHDLLAAAGINLGSVHVGAHGQSGGHPREQPAPGLHTSPDAGLPATIQASSWVAHGRGMVDIYA
jgi:flagellar hook-length control protein FliK